MCSSDLEEIAYVRGMLNKVRMEEIAEQVRTKRAKGIDAIEAVYTVLLTLPAEDLKHFAFFGLLYEVARLDAQDKSGIKPSTRS